MRMIEDLREIYEDYLSINMDIVENIDDLYSFKFIGYEYEEVKSRLAYDMAVLTTYIIHEPYFNEAKKQELKKLVNEKKYEDAFHSTLYEWENAYLAITVKSTEINGLTRKLLIPYRNNLSDLMYAVLGSLRTMAYHLMHIRKCGCTYVTDIEGNEDFPDFEIASEYYAFEILNLNNATFTYDYGEDWSFKITNRKSKYITNDRHFDDVILEDASGYGIYEDAKWMLMDYVEDNEAEYEGVKIKDLLGFDYYNAELEELKEDINGYFEGVKLSYEPNGELDDYFNGEQ